jgi:hypothetical protein
MDALSIVKEENLLSLRRNAKKKKRTVEERFPIQRCTG